MFVLLLPNPIISSILEDHKCGWKKRAPKEESSTNNKFVVNLNIYYLKIFKHIFIKKRVLLQHSWGFKFVQRKTINNIFIFGFTPKELWYIAHYFLTKIFIHQPSTPITFFHLYMIVGLVWIFCIPIDEN
jgi:hypothetical protein